MVEFLKECADTPRFDRYDVATKALRRYFDGRTLNGPGALESQDINEYKRGRAAEGAAPATIRKELIVFSSAINNAIKEWGWKIENPIRGRLPKKPKGRVRWITPDEADRLITEARGLKRAPYLANLVQLALHTGMRRGELLGLTWKRVDFRHRRIYFAPVDQKSEEHGSIPLNDAALEALNAQLGNHKDFVFAYRGARLASIKRSFATACERAKITDFHLHDLRHTFAAWLVQAGVGIREVAELMRHADINTTMIYAHLAPEMGQAAVARLVGFSVPRKAGNGA